MKNIEDYTKQNVRGEKMCKVAILLPTYNGQKYILPFLNSLYKQTYRPIRIIVSDDASTDRTVDIIKRWAQAHKSDDFALELIKNNKNVGLAQNIRRMSQLVQEEYVFLADQDDIWHKEKVRCQVDFLQEHPDVIECICDRSIIDQNNKLLCKSENRYRHLTRRKMKFEQVICQPSVYAANGIALRNHNLSEILDIPEGIVEQDTYITTMASTYGAIDFINKPLVYYRIHSNNLSSCYIMETNKNIFKIYWMLVKGYKRVRTVNQNDGKIIADALRQTRGIDLRRYRNNLLNRKIENPYICALKKIYTSHKVNYFYK